MLKLTHIPRRSSIASAQLGQQRVIIKLIDSRARARLLPDQQTLMVQRHQHGPAVLLRPQPVQAHSIQPLEDIPSLNMLRRSAVLDNEALNFLETSNDPLLLRRASALFFGLGELVQLGPQVIKIKITHNGPHPCSGQTPQPPRRGASPRDQAR